VRLGVRVPDSAPVPDDFYESWGRILLRPFVAEGDGDDQDAALARRARFAVNACRSTILHRRDAPVIDPLDLDDAEFADALVDLVLGITGLSANAERRQPR